MKPLIKLKQAVIVEGKYDKIRLSNIIDATVITTDGFGIFKDKDRCSLIKMLAEKCGIIILTDSDRAGQLIRKHIEKIASKGEILNVYLPQLAGKEKRKTKPSAEGNLGVEGTDDKIILDALVRAGVTGETAEKTGKKITKTDLFNSGLSGTDGALEKRRSLCRFLRLPDFLTANSLLDALNSLYGYDDFIKEVGKWKAEEAQN